MKKILLLLSILFVSVMTTACINNMAIQELNHKAVSYMDKGDTETAICRLKSNLDLDNEVYQTHYNLAVAYNTIGKYKDSIEESNKVITLKPDFADAYFTLAAAKEALAYSVIEPKEDVTTELIEVNTDADFIKTATEAIEAYNEYLSKKVNAEETEQINGKIDELNIKIKEYTSQNQNAVSGESPDEWNE
ncbi:MAG: hypothetical protein LUG16_02100 [Candidatus Gastranaerophilales bacterium]|nr:hypothetical protein [Candidatus Gastranaerophilales bacterium]